MTTGSEWLLGKVGEKKPPKSKRLKVEPLLPEQIDDVVAYMDDAAGAGKKLVEGLRKFSSALDQIQKCGLTPEALVALITLKCPKDRAGRATTDDTVMRVLEGVFRLPEHLE